jgi:excisionase family DNA binding protein
LQDITTQAGAAVEQPEFLKPRDVQRVLRISQHTCYDLLNSGAIPGAAKVGGTWRVRRSDIERMFDQVTQASER